MAKTANDVLKECGISSVPINLNSILKKYGAQAIIADLSKLSADNSVYGLLYYNKGEAKIYVSSNDGRTRQRFTVAHEIGHLVLHSNPEKKSFVDFRSPARNSAEIEADNFAGELLMPEDILLREYEKMNFPLASELANKFDVSWSAMKVRLNILGLTYYD